MKEVELTIKTCAKLMLNHISIAHLRTGLVDLESAGILLKYNEILLGNETSLTDVSTDTIFRVYIKTITFLNTNKGFTLYEAGAMDTLIKYVMTNYLGDKKDTTSGVNTDECKVADIKGKGKIVEL
jgi:hypothetical protein